MVVDKRGAGDVGQQGQHKCRDGKAYTSSADIVGGDKTDTVQRRW